MQDHTLRTRLVFRVLCAAFITLVASSLLVTASQARCGSIQKGTALNNTCNGHACSTRIHEIAFRNANCSDRSASVYCYTEVSESGPQCLEEELMRGVRVFFVHAHLEGRGLRLCDGGCTVTQGVDDVLKVFAGFLRLNTREVLILWWLPREHSADLAFAVHLAYLRAGLTELAFASNETQWPRIGELVDANTRLISIVGAD